MSNLPLEIEYKFLIKYPDTSILSAQPCYKKEEMCQLYLSIPDENGQYTNCRIRKTVAGEKVRYIKTFKKPVSMMTRIEVESEISKEEFDSLSKFLKPGFSPIEKVRHSFSLHGFTYEVDVFPFWSDRAFMEVEVQSESITPPCPDFIRVIKDVTEDVRYRNSALAKEIITEDI